MMNVGRADGLAALHPDRRPVGGHQPGYGLRDRAAGLRLVFRMPPGGGSGNKMWLGLQSAHQMGSQPTFLQTDIVADSGLP